MTLRFITAGFLAALTLSCSTPSVRDATAPQVVVSTMADGKETVAVGETIITIEQEKADAQELVKKWAYVANADYYRFEPKGKPKLEFETRIVLHRSFKSLAIAHGDVSLEGVLMAFTYPNKDASGVCEIHILDPQVLYYSQYIGHELLHCAYGNWHPTQG